MTAFTDLVGCAEPLQLAGMGGVSGTEVPRAVARAGGLGMIGAAALPAADLSAILEDLSNDGIVGVNFLLPFLDPAAVPVAARACRVVEFFWGEPDASLVETVHGGGALASWQVGSAVEAAKAIEVGCDLVVAQGMEAGGHVRGSLPLVQLLSEIGTAPVPIVAAGGLGTAADVARAFDAGAAGVRVGTRFLAANESIAHDSYVDALIRATRDDTVVTTEFAVGWPDAPARVLRSSLDAARAAEDPVGSIGEWPIPRFSPMTATKDVKGNIAAMPHYAGFSVDAVRARMPAAAIVDELLSEI